MGEAPNRWLRSGKTGTAIEYARMSVKTEKDKPAADLTSEAMPKQTITDFSMADKALVIGYSFTWEGNAVSAVISMTPAADGPMKAQIDFAGGAYVMTGTAAKKDKK